MRKYVFAILLTTAIAGCKAPVCDCFDSAGKPGSQVREVPFFTQIVANDNVSVHIRVGNPEKVIITGGGNLLSNISADVNNGVLSLHNNNICNWLRSYKKSGIDVFITMPQLTSITNSGYGTVSSEGTLTFDSLELYTTNSPGDINLTVNAKYINAHMFGTADLTLSGQCQDFFTNYFGGTGFVYNSGLVVSNYAYVSSNTTGDCYVNCSGGTLAVAIYGQGNVYFSGTAMVQSIPGGGSGRLIRE